MDFVKSLFTGAQWARVMDYLINMAFMLLNNAERVALVMFLVFSTTQVFKIMFRRISALPTPADWAIHLVAISSALVWSVFLLDSSPLDEKLAYAFVGWGLTFLLVQYGGALLRAYTPKFWAAVNLDRRSQDIGPPGGIDRRNDK